MNISLGNGWGIVRMLVDMCMRQPEGRYVLVKDPNNVSGSVRVFSAALNSAEILVMTLTSHSFDSTLCLSTLSSPSRRKRKRRKMRKMTSDHLYDTRVYLSSDIRVSFLFGPSRDLGLL